MHSQLAGEVNPGDGLRGAHNPEDRAGGITWRSRCPRQRPFAGVNSRRQAPAWFSRAIGAPDKSQFKHYALDLSARLSSDAGGLVDYTGKSPERNTGSPRNITQS
jgi:hypothetical protein